MTGLNDKPRGRICQSCGGKMTYNEKLRLWQCPRCRAMEEGEPPSGNPGKQQYEGLKTGGPLRSQKRS